MNALPALFVSHGSPMLALDGGATASAWRKLAADIPAPRAVLIISAHWETVTPAVTAAPAPETIHDFGGFPQPLYEIQYPARGAPWLADRVRDLLNDANLPATIDATRGIDHGAWVPLREMFPAADVPVAQLSLQSHLGTLHHYRLGRALGPLRDAMRRPSPHPAEVRQLVADLQSKFEPLANQAENLIQFVNIGGSLFYGTILGIFLVAFYLKKVGSNAVFAAALIAEVSVLSCYFYFYEEIAFLYYNIIGCMIVVGLALVFQLFDKKSLHQA